MKGCRTVIEGTMPTHDGKHPRKERPICRVAIDRLINEGDTLDHLASGDNPNLLTSGMLTQARLMKDERDVVLYMVTGGATLKNLAMNKGEVKLSPGLEAAAQGLLHTVGYQRGIILTPAKEGK